MSRQSAHARGLGLLMVCAVALAGCTPAAGTGSPSASPGLTETIYIADRYGYIEKVTPDGMLTIVAGNRLGGDKSTGPVPGPALNSPIGLPLGLVVDAAGNIYFVDAVMKTNSFYIEKVTPDGTLSIVAGNGVADTPVPGPAVDSPLYLNPNIRSLAIDTTGNLYIPALTIAPVGLSGDVVVKVTPDGVLSVIAGNGLLLNYGPDKGIPTPGPAADTAIGSVQGLAVDASGTLYIASERCIAMVKDGVLSVVAGNGGTSKTPIPGPAVDSPIIPRGAVVDAAGNLYIPSYDPQLLKVTPDGILSIFAGYRVDGPTPTPATGFGRSGVGMAVGGAGDMYFPGGGSVDRLVPDGGMSTVAGHGNPGMPPQNGLATASPMDPVLVAVGPS